MTTHNFLIRVREICKAFFLREGGIVEKEGWKGEMKA